VEKIDRKSSFDGGGGEEVFDYIVSRFGYRKYVLWKNEEQE